MTIIINCSNLRSGGGLQVALSILQEAAAFDHAYHIILSPAMAELTARRSWPEQYHFYPLSSYPSKSAASFLRFITLAKRIERRVTADAVLTVFGPSLWKSAAPQLCGYANCLYIFPQSFFIRNVWPAGLFEQVKYRLRRLVSLSLLQKNSNALWAETSEAQRQLQEQVGSTCPVFLIPNTVSTAVRESLAVVRPRPALPGVFRLLTVSAAHVNKNIKAIRALLPFFPNGSVRFTVTLSDAEFRRIFAEDAAHPALKNIGPVDPADLAAAMRDSDAAFLPTLLEVESAAYYEAMTAGLPIITSELPFARAQCGEAALYYRPLSAQAAAEQINRLMSDNELYKHLVEKGIAKSALLPLPSERTSMLLTILQAMDAARKAAS